MTACRFVQESSRLYTINTGAGTSSSPVAIYASNRLSRIALQNRVVVPFPKAPACLGAFQTDMYSDSLLRESDPVDVPQLTPAELTAIMSEAHAWGRKVAAHSHGDLAAKHAIDAGVDSIEHGSFLQPATLQPMKQKDVSLVPTRLALVWTVRHADGYPPKIAAKARAAGAAHDQMFKDALKIGVPIAFGTDSAVSPHGMNAQQFGDMVDLCMTPSAALLSNSQGSAKLLGIDSGTGTVETGKFADIVAVPGDVLQDIRASERPVFVMKQWVVARGK